MQPNIAICFFGITRSLSFTINSIRHNVVEPAQALGQAKIYSHFFKQAIISNPRTREKGNLNINEYSLLKSDWLKIEEPDTCLDIWNFDDLKSYGDRMSDDFRSIRNLVHQLHSIHSVTEAILLDAPDICIFCRPDLEYHDTLSSTIKRAARLRSPGVFLPYWQPWGGANDRFAICVGMEAIRAYGNRVELANAYCRENGPLHAEKLLRYALEREAIPQYPMSNRATRVRFDGNRNWEDFRHPTKIWLLNKINLMLGRPLRPTE